ncbi:uncharacterized protein [Pleurodeles waltl]|uniref:uncharacterized protein n=1 Tax=Pleurodeles waltl TaxID=8319 RepID=UPI0037097454
MDLQSEQQTLKLKMADLMVRVHTLEHRVEDVTGSDHRNNIRIVGLPEGLGGNGIVAYLEHWLHTKVALVQLIPFFAWERVHHVPAHPLAPGQPAQIGVVYLHKSSEALPSLIPSYGTNNARANLMSMDLEKVFDMVEWDFQEDVMYVGRAAAKQHGTIVDDGGVFKPGATEQEEEQFFPVAEDAHGTEERTAAELGRSAENPNNPAEEPERERQEERLSERTGHAPWPRQRCSTMVFGTWVAACSMTGICDSSMCLQNSQKWPARPCSHPQDLEKHSRRKILLLPSSPDMERATPQAQADLITDTVQEGPQDLAL